MSYAAQWTRARARSLRQILPSFAALLASVFCLLAATLAPAKTPLHRQPPRRCSDACCLYIYLTSRWRMRACNASQA